MLSIPSFQWYDIVSLLFGNLSLRPQNLIFEFEFEFELFYIL